MLYEQLFNNIKFDLLTKKAVWLNTLDKILFPESTLFNFQKILTSNFIRTDENLLEIILNYLTVKQLQELKIKTDIQKTGSFQTAQNIIKYSRLQLIIVVLIGIYRVMSKEYEEQYCDNSIGNGISNHIIYLKPTRIIFNFLVILVNKQI